MTSRVSARPLDDCRKSPIASAPFPAAVAAPFWRSVGFDCFSPARRRIEPLREQLPRALAVEPRPVLRVQRACGGRAGDVVRHAHARERRAHACVDDRGRDARLAEDRDRGLAGAELGQELLEVVGVGLRERPHGRPQRLRVVRRERAQRVLDAIAELTEDVGRHVLRRLRHEEDADALRADEPHRLHRRLDERLARTLEQEVCLVEEEDEPRLVAVADLGQLLEELGDEPHENGRPEPRLVLHGRQLEARDHAAPVRVRSQEIGDVELRLAEELVAAAGLERDERAQEDAHGLRREAADALQLLPSALGVEKGQERAQIGEVEEREALLVGVVEDEPEALLLRRVRAEHLREEQRPEVGDGRAHRHAGADAAEREVLDGISGRLERQDRARPRASSRGRPSEPGTAMPETSPLTSAANTATPAAESCSAMTCSVRVFPVPVAPAIRPWRFIVASGRRTAASGTSAPSSFAVPSSIAPPLVAYASAIAAPKVAGSGALRAMARDRISALCVSNPSGFRIRDRGY